MALQLDDLQPTIIFQQDGAQPHWGLHVRELLYQTFPDWLIRRDRPIPRPTRSLDLSPGPSFYEVMFQISCIEKSYGEKCLDV